LKSGKTQLFTAVIIETFDEQADADKAMLSLDKLNEFVDAWTSLVHIKPFCVSLNPNP
jgi:hypothetical protein